ncbi:cyclin B-like guanine nucleotide binding protein [Encephalitozoon romaleae SJ-2008]|uniref:Cyclin B-like guanine nucleotide binding protein n=1 Tax=Encephalitozoon romaleae (strain SJ-2008) TaxID=1178016 RepID=I6ZI63_ENCRO|nr:cyclin B-like guanine nucleotide binding protein [Encephalitozoon romaleae SJ-2008]AFN82913.1 cyclin B-like guanine nucleotide binding protein [Encephalitozoon romaleae SJ-2008]
MNLITGYFKHTRKIKEIGSNAISEVYISTILEHCNPDEYLITDGRGRIPMFKCIRNDSKVWFKGYLKYKLGDKNRRFRLAEGTIGKAAILMGGKYFYVLMEESDAPTKYLIFSEGALKEKEVDFSISPENIQEEFGKCKSEAHSQVVLCFLKSIKPQYHAQFLYFYVSNVEAIYGQVLASWADGAMIFHTLTSPLFLNFNELFSNQAYLRLVYGIPYFPHTNFTISHQWQKIYESNSYEFTWCYPPKFLLEVISLVLLEERIVFYSSTDSSLRVLQIMELMKPFRWPHIICLPLLSGMEEILESPLPFITCLSKRLKIEGVTLVDLDSLKICSSKKHALLPNKKIKNETAKNGLREIRNCIELIATEILLWREHMIKRWGCKIITKIPNNPLEFIGRTHRFYNDFFRTRMFLAFITEERDYLCRYLVEIGSGCSVILLPYAWLNKHMYTKVLRLWIELFDGDLEPVIENLIRNDLLSDVAEIVFRRLSYKEDHGKIDAILPYISSPTHEMYMNINVVSKMPKVIFKDLYFYSVYHLKACDCKALDLKELHCVEDSEWRKKQGLMDIVRKEVKEMLEKMNQELFDPQKEKCGCRASKSAILVTGPEYRFLCFLLIPENISLALKFYGSEDLLEKNPQVYWSIVTYFLYFNLPLGSNPGFDGEVDVIIDEPVLDFRVDGRPRFYIDF